MEVFPQCYIGKVDVNRLIFVTIALVFSLLLLTGINAQDGITVTDVNDDGVVDILDLTYVASHFGESSDPTQTPSPDVNGGGVVNILDLVIVANIIGDGKTETMPSDNTLIFGRGGDSITLDPSQVLDGESAKVCDMIFDTLVQYREDTTDIEPALAVAWDSSANGLTWTFHLRQGVQFHDGTPFNAEDKRIKPNKILGCPLRQACKRRVNCARTNASNLIRFWDAH